MSIALNNMGLYHKAKSFIEGARSIERAKAEAAEAQQRLLKLKDSWDDTKVELGEQCLSYHFKKPLNIPLQDGTIVRVQLKEPADRVLGPDDVIITHERLAQDIPKSNP